MAVLGGVDFVAETSDAIWFVEAYCELHTAKIRSESNISLKTYLLSRFIP
jgi:hypothetical protein